MATKFVLATVLFALVAFASATTYTMVVTTTVEDQGSTPKSCQTEIQQFQPQQCMQYLQQSRGTLETPFLRRAIADPNPEYPQGCCSELTSLSSPCRCEAMRNMYEQMKQQPSMEKEAYGMKEKLESLPRICGFGSTKECRIRTFFF